MTQKENNMLARRSHSDPYADLLGCGLFVIIFVIAMIVGAYETEKEKKRRSEIASYCRRSGIVYSEIANDIPSIAYNFSLMQEKGHTNEWRVEMSGSRGPFDFYLFEHYYVSGSGKSRHSETNTICILTKVGTNMPQFFARDENMILDGLGKLFGGQDINFADDPEFSRKFVLQGMSEHEIRKFFNRRVRSTFVMKHYNGYKYEGYGNCFMIMVPGKLELEQRLTLLANTVSIFQGIIPKEDDYLS